MGASALERYQKPISGCATAGGISFIKGGEAVNDVQSMSERTQGDVMSGGGRWSSIASKGTELDMSIPARVFRAASSALRAVRSSMSMLLVCVFASACGGTTPACVACELADGRFYAETALTVDKPEVALEAGQTVEVGVLVVYRIGVPDGNGTGDVFAFDNVSLVRPIAAGLTADLTSASASPGGASLCTAADIPFNSSPPELFSCRRFKLTISNTTSARVGTRLVLSAQWTGAPRLNPAGPATSRVIERVAYVGLVGVPVPVVPVPPDFQVAVAAVPGGIYATRATLPISITRIGGFAEVVTLEFNGLASGIGGTFQVEPIATDRRNLQLQIPARYAGGGRVDLRVTATAAGGITKVVNFSQFIEPLFRINVEPSAALLTTASALRVDVSLEPGNPFRTTSLGHVDLSISPLTPLPPGVTAMFLDDATPVSPVLPILKVSRVLRLVTDGSQGVMGPLQIRGTARGLPADIYGEVPFVETTLDLSVVQGQFWQFVGNNLTYGVGNSEVIGIALQTNNRPAFAWLQGPRSGGRVFLRRFDGTTFASSPPGGEASPLTAPSGVIAEASFALSRADVAEVAFTYDGGAYLALASAGAPWSLGGSIVVGDPADASTSRARSPRVASGPANEVVISYIREANAATTTGGVLHVLNRSGSGLLVPLSTSLPGGALNASPTGSAVRHATALALRADGNPYVAWIEQPTNPAIANTLWLRAYDGNDWGRAIRVPTPATPVGTSVQLLVEPSGLVVVAWLEGNPAQLKLLRYDPSSQAWTPLDNTGNGRGSLNVTVSAPALDVHLASHPDGRLLATWTEGGAEPQVWIKRRDADGVWRLVGTTVSQVNRFAKTPRIVSDANNRLYVAWAQHGFGRGPETVNPYADIDVAQWVFP